MVRTLAVAFLAVCLLDMPSLQAQETKDLRRGREFVQRACAVCHAIRPGATVSPVPAAPTFQAIASRRGLTAKTLRAAIDGKHQQMPSFALTLDEIKGVTAYVLSLRQRR
jgi:mono/diheme cytochrome c family protein